MLVANAASARASRTWRAGKHETLFTDSVVTVLHDTVVTVLSHGGVSQDESIETLFLKMDLNMDGQIDIGEWVEGAPSSSSCHPLSHHTVLTLS